MKIVFVVDDSDTTLSLAKEALKEHYRVMTLPSAQKMLALIEKVIPDLILLDIEMPEMDGFEALRRLKNNPSLASIPVIFLTSITDPLIEVQGFELGAVDFISKPFSAPVLLYRIRSQLNIDEIIKERTAQLQRLQNSTLYVLADMVESRDATTGGHLERTTAYIKLLIEALLENGVYIDQICDIDFDIFASSARLHDVGKIAISDNILNKPGKLTDDEFTVMKTHAMEGEQIIKQIISRSEDEEFFYHAKLFAGYHHERWDGTGYPYSLKGEDIPLQGRLMAFVDVFDALISERPYKKALSHDESIQIIMDNAGTQFDPNIAEVFGQISDQLKTVNET
ncbi:MAG: response regulator [Coriobacteriia bacterium]|nr:response regulator [Coriobacteriia bacterium]